ncbi:hypothetical protein PIB30_076716 [Stylosanthes scabra]|uniref:Uncharacterized protein n=1 Tax=Stylosanthes scabra TaxID=79078 RepID=A0ABU6TR13_9FABA|nr:hypothetical protein [Stylosanthes scabra]
MKLITTQESIRNAPSSGMTSGSSHGWSGPFTILKVSPYGHAEIQNDRDGTKFMVNGQRLKHYLGEVRIFTYQPPLNIDNEGSQANDVKRALDGRRTILCFSGSTAPRLGAQIHA